MVLVVAPRSISFTVRLLVYKIAQASPASRLCSQPTMIHPTLSFLLLFSSLSSSLVFGQATLSFRDVTEQVGVFQLQRSFKWGGPSVADLDGDGIYDLILSYHAAEPLEIYWGQPDGTFSRDPFFEDGDIHGVTVALRTTSSQTRVLSINKGGGRGNRPSPPTVYLVDTARNFVNITDSFGLGAIGSRGRVTQFMDLSLRNSRNRRRTRSGPDMLVVGFLDQDDTFPQHAYQNIGGNYALRDIDELVPARDGGVMVADVDGDGELEVISFPRFLAFKLIAPFRLVESTDAIFGSNSEIVKARTASSVVEFDLMNRGRFDLFIARAPRDDLFPNLNDRRFPNSNQLFQQTRSGLVDISDRAGVPRDTRSMGVTAGDFDNDGYVDLFVTVFEGPDFFLMNNRNQTFARVDSMIPKEEGVFGGHAVAADYDMDGRLDLFVGQGGQSEGAGPYRIMRNVMARSTSGNYLLVRVGIHPRRIATPLHAVVTVRAGGMRMQRRVGGSGTQMGGPSYLDTVHFGLGTFDTVASVSVRWVAGNRAVVTNVEANQKITIGIVN